MPAPSVRPHPLRTPLLRRWCWRLRRPAAALCAAAAVLVTIAELRSPGPATTPILVAAHDIAAGTALTDDDLALVNLPVGTVPDGSATSTDGFLGAITAIAIPAGLSLVPDLLAPELSTPPTGAVVVPVRFADDALTTLLIPGMRLDVVATELGSEPRRVATAALVLAPATASDAQGGHGLLSTGADATGSPVLLAVDPSQAVDLSAASAAAGLTAILVD